MVELNFLAVMSSPRTFVGDPEAKCGVPIKVLGNAKKGEALSGLSMNG